MKIRIQITIACIILLNIPSGLFAQKTPNHQINFSGRIKDPQLKIPYTKIRIFYSTTDWFATKNAGHDIYTDIDSNGNFKFSLPNLNKPYKVSLTIYNIHNGNNDQTKVACSYIFFTEPEDDIKIELIQASDNSLKFSGRGAEKYNLAKQIQDQYLKYSKELSTSGSFVTIKDTLDLRDKMDYLTQLTRKYKAIKTDLLDHSRIHSKIRTILNYECGVLDYNNNWTFQLKLIWDKYPPYRPQLADYFLRYNGQFFQKPDSLAKYCSFYIGYLVQHHIMRLLVENRSDKTNLKTLYDTIKSSYTGAVRDRALANVLINTKVNWSLEPSSSFTRDSLLTDAHRLFKIQYMKEAMIDVRSKLRMVTNQKVFNGEFTTNDGNKISLDELRGKVVLIDSWFNGCFACAAFHSDFHKDIFPKFRKNKDFVVLSLNIDKDRARWKAGIASGKYTLPEYINVTTGNWFEHPFMKHYRVTVSPWMMLIDRQGNIVWQPNGFTYEEMTAKIAAALNADLPSEK